MNEALYKVVEVFVKEHLLLHAILISLAAAMIVVGVVIDLIFGVRKAKLNGEATTSTGYKKTCEKMRKYFSPFMVLVGIDLIGCVILPLPAFSMLWAAWCVFCEFISVREKSWQKAELRKQERTLNLIVENKDDIAKLAVDLLTKIGEKSNLKSDKDENSNT